MKSYELGKAFSPKVDHYIYRDGDKWKASVNIGEENYYSDPCKYKANALAEVLGYLEGIESLLKAEIDAIKKELEDEK